MSWMPKWNINGEACFLYFSLQGNCLERIIEHQVTLYNIVILMLISYDNSNAACVFSRKVLIQQSLSVKASSAELEGRTRWIYNTPHSKLDCDLREGGRLFENVKNKIGFSTQAPSKPKQASLDRIVNIRSAGLLKIPKL